VLSQTIQFLSRLEPVAVVTGLLQVRPPSVERRPAPRLHDCA
jgi:hypothetical protein